MHCAVCRMGKRKSLPGTVPEKKTKFDPNSSACAEAQQSIRMMREWMFQPERLNSEFRVQVVPGPAGSFSGF